VPFKNVKTLSEKILYLYNHPDMAKRMGKKGRERIEREFSLNVIMRQMKKLYTEILNE
jgi:glycosyltransferase involved in cell wall biosynthesis